MTLRPKALAQYVGLLLAAPVLSLAAFLTAAVLTPTQGCSGVGRVLFTGWAVTILIFAGAFVLALRLVRAEMEPGRPRSEMIALYVLLSGLLMMVVALMILVGSNC